MDPTNAEEARILGRCVDPQILAQDGKPNPYSDKSTADEATNDQLHDVEDQDPEEHSSKSRFASKGEESSKRTAAAELSALVPKKPRTTFKPHAKYDS